MITQQTQIKLNVSIALKDYLESKARKFGLTVAGYVKHLILKDVEEMEYPTFHISEQSEKRLKEAMKHRDKAVDASVFLRSLTMNAKFSPLVQKEIAYFFDIGTHDEVYRK